MRNVDIHIFRERKFLGNDLLSIFAGEGTLIQLPQLQ